VATEQELQESLVNARQIIVWRIVDRLNKDDFDVDEVRSLAAAYNMLSQTSAGASLV